MIVPIYAKDENGYCELQVKFDKDTNKLEITL
jgi:hypothetical protein